MSTNWDDDFDVLPDTTTDESPAGWGEERDDSNDDRLIENRPPHWE